MATRLRRSLRTTFQGASYQPLAMGFSHMCSQGAPKWKRARSGSVLPGEPSRSLLRPRLHAFFSNLGSAAWRAAVVGVLFGVAVQILNTDANGGWRIPGILLETRTAWCAASFVVGAFVRTRLHACVAGFVVEIAAILGYYATQCLQGQESWGQMLQSLRVLSEVVVVVGPLFGLAGRLATSSGASRHLWRAVVPLAAAAESAMALYVGAPDPLTGGVAVAELICSSVALLGLGFSYAWSRVGAVRTGQARTGGQPPDLGHGV